jgi:hypothetical protein
MTEFDTMAEELRRAAKHDEWCQAHPDEDPANDPDRYDITPCITWDDTPNTDKEELK